MEYERLYTEYKSAIETQKDVIESYLKKMKNAKKSADFKEISRLAGILKILYTEKGELEQLADKLRDYIT